MTMADQKIRRALLSVSDKAGLIEFARALHEHGIALGSRVVITSESFGPEPTEGELIAATRTRYSLRRVDERAGEVHVHFPRIGYVLKAVQPA